MLAKNILNVLKTYIMVYIIIKFRDFNLLNQKLRQGENFAATPLIQKGGPKSPRRMKLLKLVSLISLKRLSVKKLKFLHQNKKKHKSFQYFVNMEYVVKQVTKYHILSSKWPRVISKLTLEEGDGGVGQLQKKLTGNIIRICLKQQGF